MKYPYIGKGKSSGSIVLIYADSCGITIDSKTWASKNGDFESSIDEGCFDNITREYLEGKCVKIESPEHSEFVQKLAFNAGFKWGVNGCNYAHQTAPYLTFHSSGAMTFSVLSKDSLELAIIPLPPKMVETETPEEASEFDRIEMVSRVNNEAEDWPQVGDEVECGGCYGVVMGIDDNMLWVLKDSSMYDTYHIGSVKRPKTPEQILTGKVESLIADSLKESNFTGDIGLGDIASIITSNLELYFKVSDL